MPRAFVRFAVVFAVAVCAQAALAQMSSTHCVESDVALDALHSSSRLERCGDGESTLLWHLDRIDQIGGELDGQFDRRNSGAGSVIYVMDTGIMASHAEFAAGNGGTRVVAGYDVTGSVDIGRSRCTSPNKALAPCYENFDELPAASHGTSVASIAAGHTIGVAPDASVVSIRVMNERGLATTRTYLEGLDAIVRHAYTQAAPAFHTAVVNISGWVLERLNASSVSGPVVKYSEVEQKMRDMIFGVDANGRRDANGKRFFFVVAANNTDGGCGTSGIIDRFPALLGRSTDGLITVGGMTASNTTWAGTCRGGVEVLAPAQGIFSATITGADHYRGRKPNLRSGTSFAAPIIAGIAARLLSDHPELTPEQLETWITDTPSRVSDPSDLMANGKVATVRAYTPVMASGASAGTRLEP